MWVAHIFVSRSASLWVVHTLWVVHVFVGRSASLWVVHTLWVACGGLPVKG